MRPADGLAPAPELDGTRAGVEALARWVAINVATGAVPPSVAKELLQAGRLQLAKLDADRQATELDEMRDLDKRGAERERRIDQKIAALRRRGIELSTEGDPTAH